MRDFLNKSIKKTNQTLTKNLLQKLVKVKVGFEEVEEIAQHLLDQQKGGNKTRNETILIIFRTVACKQSCLRSKIILSCM